MDTKEELVKHIRGWIQIDNDISTLQKQMKTLREDKKNLTASLVDVMKSNDIDCFDINDGKLIYAKSKYKKPINKKSLSDALQSYFKNDTELAQELSNHIMNTEIQKKIQTLNEQRKKYVAVEMKKQQKGGKTLGSAVIQAVREQAKKKNFKFEPPKKPQKTALEKGD